MDTQRRLAMPWRKSQASGSGNCVEVAATGASVYVRDSKYPDGPTLEFTVDEWTAFLAGVHQGEFSATSLGAFSAGPRGGRR